MIYVSDDNAIGVVRVHISSHHIIVTTHRHIVTSSHRHTSHCHTSSRIIHTDSIVISASEMDASAPIIAHVHATSPPHSEVGMHRKGNYPSCEPRRCWPHPCIWGVWKWVWECAGCVTVRMCVNVRLCCVVCMCDMCDIQGWRVSDGRENNSRIILIIEQ